MKNQIIFLLPSSRKEVMPVILYNAMPQASLLMYISLSDLIDMAMLFVALISLVVYCGRKK